MAYVKIIYQNSPSTATPINAENLNHMDDQIALNDQRLTEIETSYVKSFNGRKGEVVPKNGDYDIGQIAPLTGAQVGQVPVVVNHGTEEDPELVFEMGAGGSGGHTIENTDGTEMPQEENLQFVGLKVIDDSVNGKTIVDATDKVTWEANGVLGAKNLIPYPYPNMSTTVRGITWGDNGDGGIIGNGTGTEASAQPYCDLNGNQTNNAKDLLLKANTWYALTCKRTSPYAIGANIYFLNPTTMLQKSYTYDVIFGNTSQTQRTSNNIYMFYNDIVYDEVKFRLSEDVYAQVQVRYRKGTDVTVVNDVQYPMLRLAEDTDDTYQPYAMTNLELTKAVKSGGGHSIIDSEGNTMPQETAMQFPDSHVSDDDVNDKTVVENVKEVTLAELSQATERGMYLATDEESVPYPSTEEDVVSVTADGDTTRRDLFNWIFNHCDTTKITKDSYIVYSGNGRIYHYEDINNGTYIFAWESIRATTIEKVCLQLNSSTSTEIDWTLATTGNTKEENYSYKPASGNKYILHYGSSSGIVELNTEVSYSTTERKIGKWINGSDLYEKTVNIGALPNATNKAVAHGITNLDEVVSIAGFARRNNVRLSIPYVGIVSTDGVQVYVNDSTIVITAGGDASAYSGYVTLRYTKS